jgi:hypothetical protein
LGSTPTAPSKLKPSTPDEIVELRSPTGNSVTHKVYRIANADTLKLLLSMNFTVVTPEDSAK